MSLIQLLTPGRAPGQYVARRVRLVDGGAVAPFDDEPIVCRCANNVAGDPLPLGYVTYAEAGDGGWVFARP